MATTPNGKKMTREEKKAVEAADRYTKRVNEFKAGFLKDRSRRVWTRKDAFECADAYDGCVVPDMTGMSLYDLIHKFTDAKDRLSREMRNCMESLEEMRLRLDSHNQDPMTWSNGLCARYGTDIDKYAVQMEAMRSAIHAVAQGSNWRVREIESSSDQAFADSCARIDVVACGGGFGIRQIAIEPGDTCGWFSPNSGSSPIESFQANGVQFDTEELAWAAMALIVTGREL